MRSTSISSRIPSNFSSASDFQVTTSPPHLNPSPRGLGHTFRLPRHACTTPETRGHPTDPPSVCGAQKLHSWTSVHCQASHGALLQATSTAKSARGNHRILLRQASKAPPEALSLSLQVTLSQALRAPRPHGGAQTARGCGPTRRTHALDLYRTLSCEKRGRMVVPACPPTTGTLM